MKTLFLCLVMLSLPFVSGCAGCRNELKHMKSDFVGLNRHIVLYSSDGGIIKEWKTRAKFEDRGGTVYFLNDDGNAVTVSGTFVVEEL